jgi:hypothetical protein
VKRALLVLALVLVFAPAAEARCAPQQRVAHAKAKGCRKMLGQLATVRASWPMVAAGSSEAAPTPPGGDPAAPDPAAPPSPPPAARLGVIADEWSLVLSRSLLPAGHAIVQLQNFGDDAHNLRLESADATLDVPLTESGDVGQAGGTLPAGDYKVYCTLPGHDAAGMHARVTVQ